MFTKTENERVIFKREVNEIINLAHEVLDITRQADSWGKGKCSRQISLLLVIRDKAQGE